MNDFWRTPQIPSLSPGGKAAPASIEREASCNACTATSPAQTQLVHAMPSGRGALRGQHPKRRRKSSADAGAAQGTSTQCHCGDDAWRRDRLRQQKQNWAPKGRPAHPPRFRQCHVRRRRRSTQPRRGCEGAKQPEPPNSVCARPGCVSVRKRFRDATRAATLLRASSTRSKARRLEGCEGGEGHRMRRDANALQPRARAGTTSSVQSKRFEMCACLRTNVHVRVRKPTARIWHTHTRMAKLAHNGTL